MKNALHLRVRGRVQGVGYRASMCDEAQRLGVSGWVRNRHDGSVEAVAWGPPDAVARLVVWAGHGPRWASVDAVDTRPARDDEAAPDTTHGFATRPTA